MAGVVWLKVNNACELDFQFHLAMLNYWRKHIDDRRNGPDLVNWHQSQAIGWSSR